MFSFKRLIRSHKFAIEGLKSVFKEEQSFRAQLLIAAIVGLLMLYLPLSSAEKVVLILAIMMVLILELINSQIERILDILEPNYNERVKRIKDISAAAVLIACLSAAFIGLLIFLPYFGL